MKINTLNHLDSIATSLDSLKEVVLETIPHIDTVAVDYTDYWISLGIALLSFAQGIMEDVYKRNKVKRQSLKTMRNAIVYLVPCNTKYADLFFDYVRCQALSCDTLDKSIENQTFDTLIDSDTGRDNNWPYAQPGP